MAKDLMRYVICGICGVLVQLCHGKGYIYANADGSIRNQNGDILRTLDWDV